MKKWIKLSLLLCCMVFLMGCETDTTSSSLESTQNTAVQVDASNSESQSQETLDNVVEVSNLSPSSQNAKEYNTTVTDIEGGKLYSTGRDEKIDIIVGDDYFATQLADMTINFDNYEGKVIEIEGFALKNAPWTFVGRYSENAICPTCPVGYAYYEYEWHGNEPLDLGDEENWVKVTGKLTRGNDGSEYYYIDAYKIAVMDQWGEVSKVVN